MIFYCAIEVSVRPACARLPRTSTITSCPCGKIPLIVTPEWLRDLSNRGDATLTVRTHLLSAVSPTSLKKLQKFGTGGETENRVTLPRRALCLVALAGGDFAARNKRAAAYMCGALKAALSRAFADPYFPG